MVDWNCLKKLTKMELTSPGSEDGECVNIFEGSFSQSDLNKDEELSAVLQNEEADNEIKRFTFYTNGHLPVDESALLYSSEDESEIEHTPSVSSSSCCHSQGELLLKTQAQLQRSVELLQTCTQGLREKTRELEKLKELEKEKDAEIKRLKGELQRNKEKEREVLSDYERSNRSILVELNDECKKTSNLLGTASKKILVGSSTFQKGTVTNGRASSSGSDVEMAGKMQVLSALGNMKGCNDDLRNKFQELKQSLEKQKRINVKASKVREKEKKSKESLESSSSLQAMKERLEKEHSEEMESLHQSLMKLKASESALQGRLVDKDSEMRQIQKSMGLWKEETALKMAKKFEEELNKELDVRMHDSFGHHTPLRRSASSERSASPPIHDASTVKLLRHLQEKVKLLRQENLSLKRGMHSSSHMTADELDTSRELLRKDHNIPKRSHSYGKLP